jgi:hypothetical protein
MTMAENVMVDTDDRIDPFWYAIQTDGGADQPELVYAQLVTNGKAAAALMDLVIRWVVLWGGVPEDPESWKYTYDMAGRWSPPELDPRRFSVLRLCVEDMKSQAAVEDHYLLDRPALFLRVLEAAADHAGTLHARAGAANLPLKAE